MAFARCQYTSDSGTIYQRKCDADLAAALSLTVEAIGAHAKLPANIKPRYVLFRDPTTGREYKAAGLPVTSGLWTGTTATVTWIPERGTTTGALLNRAGAVGEKRYQR